MITIFDNFIGRAYTPLYDGQAVVSGIAGVDFAWIISAIVFVIMIYIFFKTFCRIFIGK